MSIEDFEFRAWLEVRISSLSNRKCFHVLYRLRERLRLIHNAVGKATRMSKAMTITEFQTAYPALYNKLAPELASFVVNGYLSKAGWDYFIDNIYRPRTRAVADYISDIKQQLMAEMSPDEINPFE